MWIWISVSILLPIIMPIGIVYFIKILVHTGRNFSETLSLLWNGGAYIFVGLFSLLSLMPHYLLKSNNRGTSVYWVLTSVMFIITSCLYLSFLSIIPEEVAVSFAENFQLSIISIIIGIIGSIGFKFSVLSSQQSDNRTVNTHNIT